MASADDVADGALGERIGGYAPIESYASIGNKRTAALVARDGAIDWWCPVGFDSPSCFGALLDAERGGSFVLAPVGDFTCERRYRPGTNVLESTFTTTEGVVRVTDAMSLPAIRNPDFNQIVRRADGLDGEVAMHWRVLPRFDYGRRDGRVEDRGAATTITDGDHVLAVQAFEAGAAQRTGAGVGGSFTCGRGRTAMLAVSSFDTGPLAFAGPELLAERLEATAERWERWSATCGYDGPWGDAVLRSALALDLMIDDSTGAIVAAPTMGLPERVGGERNFDYRYAWLRDGNLTLEAMLRLGYDEQVHASLRWMFAATAGTHPWLRPMYRLDGSASLPDATTELRGYRDSSPVLLGNGAQSQLQLGCYGDVFDMVWHYVEAGNDLSRITGVRLAELADFVCRIWGRPDAGLWELHDARHYTQSKLACGLALRRARELSDRGMVPSDGAARWQAAERAIEDFVRERCWSDRLRSYTRSAGSEELDAAVLLGARGAFIADEPDRLSSTIDAIAAGLGAGGPLLYRYTGMQDEEGAFLACSFWAAESLARCGRLGEGEAMMGELIGLANDVGLYSEEIDPATGALRGNMPQALTHLALINAAHVYHQLRAPR